MFNAPPQVGMTMKVRGVLCRIVKVLPAGTVEVVALNGGVAFRVSGLSF
jgi:hypothetical protein